MFQRECTTNEHQRSLSIRTLTQSSFSLQINTQKGAYGCGSKPCTPCEHKNRWYMGVHPPQTGGIGYDPWPQICYGAWQSLVMPMAHASLGVSRSLRRRPPSSMWRSLWPAPTTCCGRASWQQVFPGCLNQLERGLRGIHSLRVTWGLSLPRFLYVFRPCLCSPAIFEGEFRVGHGGRPLVLTLRKIKGSPGKVFFSPRVQNEDLRLHSLGSGHSIVLSGGFVGCGRPHRITRTGLGLVCGRKLA